MPDTSVVLVTGLGGGRMHSSSPGTLRLDEEEDLDAHQETGLANSFKFSGRRPRLS